MRPDQNWNVLKMYAKINWKERKKPKQNKANDDEHNNSKNNKIKWTQTQVLSDQWIRK